MKQGNTKLESFIPESKDSLFSIYNLPYGVFKHENYPKARIGTAIGNHILDLTALEEVGLIKSPTSHTLFDHEILNTFASSGPTVWSAIRKRIQALLSKENKELQGNAALLQKALIPQNEVVMQLPFHVHGFSDFYASEHHATNVGKLFRPNDNALLPNWKYLPVGYNARASTVFHSGTPIVRPKGQIKLPTDEKPIFAPSKKLDFELEMGIFVGVGNPDGRRITMEHAPSHIFGLVLLNDWSARDIQSFEYQPLGPFLSKSFATSISSWVVPMEALEEVMTPIGKQEPETVEYLKQSTPKLPSIKLKVEIQPKGSKQRTTICETNFKELYWSMEQILAHHTVNHCIMKPGDLLGSGTISGPKRENWGSLLEITFNGKEPIQLADGNTRTFLEDGDTIIMSGYCETDHYKIGFGSLEGTISSAIHD